MKSAYGLLAAGFLTFGVAGASCISGSTVDGSGGQTGNPGLGGKPNNGLGGSNNGLGGNNSGLGGTNTGLGGSNVGLGGAPGGSGGILGGTAGSTGTTTFMPNCAPASPLVSDMENGLFYYGTSCPKGAWHLSVGGGGTTTPLAGDLNPVAVADHAPSTKAIHVSGSGQANTTATSYDAFVSISASLNSPSTTMVGSLNAAGLTGVKFAGKITGPVEFHVPNMNTHPAGGICSTTGGLATSCYGDGEIKMLAPSAAWMQYMIPFSQLVPAGFGNPPGTPFPSGQIYTLEWHVTIPATGPVPAWDIWLDDLSFY